MLSVPLPFVVALFLVLLIVQIWRAGDDAPPNRPFLLLLAVCAVQSMLIGIRWAYGIEAVRYILPVIAAALPALVYASFGGLAEERGRAGMWPHALPAGIAVLLVAFWPAPIDLFIVAVALGYAAALMRLAGSGPDALGHVRLEGAVPAYRALRCAAAALFAYAMVDLIVILDFEWTRGAHAVTVIGTANLLSLLVLGLAATVAGRTRPPAEPMEPVAATSTGDIKADDDEAGEVVAKIEDLMRTQELYRDVNLNLNRLARKAGLPSRSISVAINRIRAENVSQFINGYRIAEACRLLTETDQPVTKIMFDVGFQTKSNFNREFRRVTAMNPRAWREKAQSAKG